MSRERLPNKRPGWHLKVNIEGQTFYLSTGEYPDGRLGEIWIHAHQEGSFSQGMSTSLARMVSIALQNDVSVGEVVRSLRRLDFPPRGLVIGSPSVRRCTSVADWIAQELEAAYPEPGGTPAPEPAESVPPANPEAPPASNGTPADTDWRTRGAMPPPDPAAWVETLRAAVVPPFNPSAPPDVPVYGGDGPKVARLTERPVPNSGEGPG